MDEDSWQFIKMTDIQKLEDQIEELKKSQKILEEKINFHEESMKTLTLLIPSKSHKCMINLNEINDKKLLFHMIQNNGILITISITFNKDLILTTIHRMDQQEYHSLKVKIEETIKTSSQGNIKIQYIINKKDIVILLNLIE